MECAHFVFALRTYSIISRNISVYADICADYIFFEISLQDDSEVDTSAKIKDCSTPRRLATGSLEISVHWLSLREEWW